MDTFTKLSARDFFAMVYQNLQEGLYADPAYGGNYEMQGWRWLGYPGAASEHGAEYRDEVRHPSRPYRPNPRSLP
jgi:gluconate 2-dehydrogenase gamma chain